MNTALAEAFAQRLALWMQTAAQAQRNAEYYRTLVERCGESIGAPAFIADDGTKSTSVLCDKVPELVEAAINEKNNSTQSLVGSTR